MADFDVKLNFDDGGIVKSLEKQAELFSKLQNEVKDFDNVSKSAGNGLKDTLIKAQSESNNLQKSISKTSDILKNGYSQKQIADVALKIAAATSESGRFAAAIEKTNQIRLNGIITDINDIENEFVDIISKANLTESEMKVLEANINEVALAMAEIDSGNLKNAAEKASVLTKEFASAKSELRALNNAINSGELKGDQLEVARSRAAALTDTIGDNREQITKLSSDTRGLDTLIEGTRAVAAGFQIAEGATALFGDENEDVQKALLKLNAIMAISNGLQEAHALFLQNSNIAMGVAKARQIAYNIAVGGSTGVLKVFRIALASTGIGLLVLALGALIANFDSVKAKVLEVVPGLEKIGSVIKGVVSGIGAFFKGVGNVFTGGVGNIVENVKKLGSDVSGAYQEGFKKNELDKLGNKLADNVTAVVDSQKRQLAVLKAGGKDSKQLQETILKNELQVLKLRGSNQEDLLKKQNELDVFYAEKRKEQSEKSSQAAQKNFEEQKKRLEDFKNELKSLQNDVKSGQRRGQLASIDDSTFDGQIAKLELQKKFDDEDLAQKKKQSLELAKTANERAQFEELYKDLGIIVQEEYNRDLKKIYDNEQKERLAYIDLLKKNEEETSKIIQEGGKNRLSEERKAKIEEVKFREEYAIKDIERQIKYGNLSKDQIKELERKKLEIIRQSLQDQINLLGSSKDDLKLGIDLKEQIKDIDAQLQEIDKIDFKSAGERIRDFIKSSFKIDDQQIDALVDGFTELKNAVISAVKAGYDAEIKALDDSIKKREENVKEIDSLISEEAKKKEEGLANDYDALVKAKADEQALIKDDNEKRVAIQRKALQIDLAIQSAQQAQSLATAVAGIFSKSAGALGVFGIPLAIAGIVSMFALFRNYRNQVKQLSQQAYKGGLISDYLQNGVKGKSDKPGHGDGHRIEGTNLWVGADEFISNAKSTSANLPFLKEFNKGTFDKVDLMKVLNKIPDKEVLILNTQRTDDIKNGNKDQYNYDLIRKAIAEQTEVIKETESKRPIVINRPDGSVEITYIKKDGSKRVEILKRA